MMNLRIEWMNILMVLGATVGGLLSVLLFAITLDLNSLWSFVICLFGGAFLGLFIEKIVCRQK